MTELSAIGYGRPDGLYDLLPLVVRALDVGQGHPLRDLLRVIGEQVAVVETGIERLGDEPFIETCSDWAVPYIGELVGWTPLADAGTAALGTPGRDLLRSAVLVPRRDVADTVRHRRRKGTLALLEELAADVAGWPSHAVELGRLLAQAQHAAYVRADRGRTVDVRAMEELERLGGAFDGHAHVVDVRRGGHNVSGAALFVWRLNPYVMVKAPAAQAEHIDGPHVFTFDPLYHDVPLFTAPGAGPPRPLTRRMLDDQPGTGASPEFYGPGRGLTITAHDWPKRGTTTQLAADQVRPADLGDWRRYRAEAGTVAVDPERGRMLFRPGQAPSSVNVTYHYGSPADLGGGAYDRPMPQLPAAAVVRFDARQLLDPATILLAVRDRGDAPYAVIRGHWPPDGLAALLEFDDTRPPSDELVTDLVTALNETVADPAFHEAVQDGVEPPLGDALLLANRTLVEELFPGIVTPALFTAVAATGPVLADQLAKWRAAAPRHGLIELTSTDIYDAGVGVDLVDGQELVIRAANGVRPIVWLPDRRPDRADSLTATLEPGCRLVLDGLTITGRAVRLTGVPAPAGAERPCATTRITLRHCTIVPGRVPPPERDLDSPPPALELADLDGAVVDVRQCVLGAVSVSGEAAEPVVLRVSDSIVDAIRPGYEAIGHPGEGVPPVVLSLARVTVRGTVLVHAVELVENAILLGELAVARRRGGCVRFSWVEPGSCTPRRYHCQPDLAVAALGPTPSRAVVAAEVARVRPRFTTTRYGGSGYFQLARDVAPEIWRGADDSSEMGAYHDLFQPQREANLLVRLAEYTPAGMTSGLVIVT